MTTLFYHPLCQGPTGFLIILMVDQGSNFGVDIATQYATLQVYNTGVITATIQNVNAATDGQTITLAPDQTFTTWTWGGTVPFAYLPHGCYR